MQYGHFDNDRREYVIDRVDLPASWTNYLGTEEMCAVVNHTAGGYLFHKSAEYHRITRFRANAVPMDRPLHLSSGRRHRGVLVCFVAARGQAAGLGEIYLPPRLVLYKIRM